MEVALAPSTRSPAVGVKVNFTKGAASPGSSRLRGLVIAVASSTGSLAGSDGTIKQAVSGADDFATYLGPASPGHLFAKALFVECPTAYLDLVTALAPTGNTATATVTFDDTSPVTADRTVTVTIAGRPITITWRVGEDDITAATKLVAAANGQDQDLPVSAANGGGANPAVVFSFKQPGLAGNDVKIYLDVADGAGGSIALSGTASDHMTGGTTEATLTNALLAVSDTTYDYIALLTSNADVGSASATSGPGKVKTQLRAKGDGANARLQQAIFGATGTTTLVKTGTAARNYERLQTTYCQFGQSLPAEWQGAEMGARMREVAINPVKNRIKMVYRATLYGARDRVNDTLTAAEEEDLLFAGVSPVGYSSAGDPLPLRPITEYFKDGSGNADDRVLDTSRVDGIFAVVNDLAVALPQEYAGQNISPDLPNGEEELPPDTTEIGEVKEFVIQRLFYWARKRGVLLVNRVLEAIGTPEAPGGLIVEIDPTDPSQVDLVVPMKTTPPLAKFSLVANQVQ